MSLPPDPKKSTGKRKRRYTGSAPGLLNKTTAVGRLYDGPLKFKGKCNNCVEPRNRHCGHCKACPGYHIAECMTGPQTGAWH